MLKLDEQALQLNKIIQEQNSNVFDMLSFKGKAIFFPKLGIISQGAEAKGKKINATIGMSIEDNSKYMILNSLNSMLNFEGKEECFSYASSYGNPNLRDIWKQRILSNCKSINQPISSPVVTNALTHGLNVCGYLFADRNTVILSPDYYWENYDLIFSHAYEANIKTFKTFNNKGGFNTQKLKETILKQKNKKIIIILNFPNNPTGYTPTIDEANFIKDTLIECANAGKNIVVLIDDAYYGLVYEEGIIKESIFSYLYNAHKNILAVKIDGATKEDYVWGFRIGFITFGIQNGTSMLYQALEHKSAGVIRGSISNAPNISQILLLNSYKNQNYLNEKKEKYEILKSRYTKVRSIINSHPEYKKYFEALPFNSGYFMCVLLKKASAEKMRQNLLSKYSVGLIAFNNILRIAFSAVPISDLDNLFKSIYQCCVELNEK